MKAKRSLNIRQTNNNVAVAIKLRCGKIPAPPDAPDGQKRTVGDEDINVSTGKA
ncbi:hypothetical protein [Caulobacter sp. FWC2]|uniref:hypothetical protein n=1 Tax=Caulobacter sp. FWC2 TaxID=69664 RepID=UPI00130468A3|nr:hypothetical protein [Caulobacter sp. FWC2]